MSPRRPLRPPPAPHIPCPSRTAETARSGGGERWGTRSWTARRRRWGWEESRGVCSRVRPIREPVSEEPHEPHVPHDLAYPCQCGLAQETMLSVTHGQLLVSTGKHAIYYPLARVLRSGSKTNFTGRGEVQRTGLLWESTPTAGSQGLFSRRDKASAPAAPVFVLEDTSIRSIKVGI